MIIVSYSQAKADGLPSYFTGKPCKNGHVASRHTAGGNCSICHAEWRKANRRERPEIYKEYNNKHYRKNKARYIEKANNRLRQFKTRSFPHEREQILEFYRNCPEGYEVDHIVPIKHELVCGLHCLANLQYLPKADNRAKGNKWTQN